MPNCSEIIVSILERNNLASTDGRMLCKYRCSEHEYVEIQTALRSVTKYRNGHLPQNSIFESAAFCLFASEWWRKNYDSGSWKWNGILGSLGMDEDHSRLDLYDPIRHGLRFWKRKLLTVGDRNAYFITLVCEGGLPLKIIHREAYSYLQQYLKALLCEFSVYGRGEVSSFDLAARLGTRLPKGLRQMPLFQICGELIEQVWNLQRQIGDSSSPVEDLDRTRPGWRDTFPLVVTDEAARALLNSLIKDAVKIARIQELRFATVLKKEGSAYRLERKAQIPPYFGAPSLSAQLQIPIHQLPYNVQLYLCQPSAPRYLLALVTRRTAGDDGKFAVEIPNGASLSLSGSGVTDQLWLEARSANFNRETLNIKGSLALSELPWIFASKDNDTDKWELIGEGSLKTRHPFVIVAVPSASTITALGEIEPLGEVPHLGRQLYRICGQVTISDGTSTTTIVTKAADEDCAQYTITGDFLTQGVFGSSIYKGFPKIVSYLANGSVQPLPESQLQWKPRRGNDGWKSDLSGCYGPVTIRYIKQGEARFMTNIDVVPRTGKISFIPGKRSCEGAIEITGMAAFQYGCLSNQTDVEITATTLPEGKRFACAAASDPPATLELYVRWHHGQELRIKVPYPARGVRFINRDGTVMRTDDIIHMSRMSGVTVQVMELDPSAAFSIEASVVSKKLPGVELDTFKLSEVAPGRHEIDLRQLQDGCRLLFSAVDDLDARIKVGVISSKFPAFPQRIYIARYDLNIQPDKVTGEIFIPQHELKALNGDVSRLEFRAFPLTNPSAQHEVLSATSPGRWQFYREGRALGPWLITGWDGDWCRVRPLCWTVFKDLTPIPVDTGERSFESVTKLITPQDRYAACEDLLSQLTADPNHSDWEKVYACFNQLKELPATTFDVVSRLARNPDAVATALLKAREDTFDEVWTALEQMPFAWYLVPVGSWLKASKLREKNMREALAPVADSFGGNLNMIIEDSFRTFFNQIPIRQPGMQVLVDYLKCMLFSTMIPDLPCLNFFTNNTFQTTRVLFLAPAEQELLQTHVDETWPLCPELQEWWLTSCCQIPQALHGLWSPASMAQEFHSVLEAPVAAAFCAAFNIKLTERMVFNIRKLREFDIRWFDVAYGYALGSSIGHCINKDMEF